MFLVWGGHSLSKHSWSVLFAGLRKAASSCALSFSRSLFVSPSNSRAPMGKAWEGLAIGGGLNSLPPRLTTLLLEVLGILEGHKGEKGAWRDPLRLTITMLKINGSASQALLRNKLDTSSLL